MLRPPYALLAAGLLLATPLRAAQPQFWRLEGARDFLDGETDGLSVDSEGRLRLAPAARLLGDPESPVVWAVTRDSKGVLYAGTGNDGKIFKLEGGKSALLYDAPELEVNALAVGPDGRLYAGTSPEGRVYAIDGAGKATTFFDPTEKYIWALAFDRHGNLMVGTGADGKIYRVDKEGKAVVLFASPETHILCLATDEKGNAYAGSSPSGIVYRIDSSGKVFVLLDSSYREAKAIDVGGDGSVYAALVDGKDKEEGGKAPSAAVPVPILPTFSTEVTVTESFSVLPATASASPTPPRLAEPPRTGGAKGAVVRILPLGEVDTLWSSADETPHALIRTTDGVLVGTGNKGKLYLIRDDRTWTMVASFPAEQVTALVRNPGALVQLATSNPGKVHTLEDSPDRKGTFSAKVRDTDTVSTWGRLRWEAFLPEGTEVQVQTRSGNTGAPDSTWSDWSAVYAHREGDPVMSPAARFLQVRAVLVGKGTASPVLDSVTAPYLQRNLRPSVQSITVHPPGEVFQKPLSVSGEMEILGLDPADSPESRQGTSARLGLPPLTSYSRKLYQRGIQTLSWKAEDPNGDSLVYEVLYRPLGETRFRSLRKGLTDSVLAWDTATVPNGRYVIRVSASDAPNNPEALALTGDRDSAPLEIDNTPPSIVLSLVRAKPDHVKAAVKDDSSSLRKAEYSIDAGRWQEVYPLDGINDSSEEVYLIPLPAREGSHVVVVRATDALGNIGTSRLAVP